MAQSGDLEEAQAGAQARLAPDLARSDDLPVGVQLAWRIRVLIASGELRPGDRLPGVRELARGTAVNVNTARAVYQRLEDEGLIRSEHGLGTFVATQVDSAPELERLAAEATRAARESGVEPRDLARAIYAGSWPQVADEPLTEPGAAEPDLPPDPDGATTEKTWSEERPARRELRRQIARLEAELAAYPEARPEGEPTHPLLRPKGHVADVGELEATRDELMQRLKRARGAAERRGRSQGHARGRLEEMVSEPAAHKWESVSNEELGEPGCTTWDVRPRFGPVGALMRWWRVKVSAGCPLSGAA